MAKLSQKTLTARVFKFIQEKELILPGEKVLVAVSGGPDSVCLFDILNTLKDKLQIKLAIVHYNHRQRGVDSEKDAEFVGRLAEDRGVNCFIGEYTGKNKKLSEDEARELRYAFFERILGEWSGDRLAIAHTLNDQAETLLLRLIRGASIFGLSSIPLQRKKISRPLLRFSRSEVLDYLAQQGLKYRTDGSNFNLDYSRNQIRHKIIPEMEKINPKTLHHLAASVELAAEQKKLIEELVEASFKTVLIGLTKETLQLDAKKLSSYSPLLQVEIIKLGLNKLYTTKDISQTHFLSIQRLIEKKIGNKKIILSKHLQVSLQKGIIEAKLNGKGQ